MIAVSRLQVAPVKGLGLHFPEEISVATDGVPGDRRFFLVNEDGRLFSGIDYGPLVQVVSESDPAGTRLSLTFPDGRVVDGEVELGEEKVTPFWGRPVRGRYVEGPWEDALSDFAGKFLRLVRVDDDRTGYDSSPVTILGDASVEELGRQAGTNGGFDARRFRMLIALAGHEAARGGRVDRRPGADRRGAPPDHRADRALRDDDAQPGVGQRATSTRCGRSRTTAACATATRSTSACSPRSWSPGGSAWAIPVEPL